MRLLKPRAPHCVYLASGNINGGIVFFLTFEKLVSSLRYESKSRRLNGLERLSISLEKIELVCPMKPDPMYCYNRALYRGVGYGVTEKIFYIVNLDELKKCGKSEIRSCCLFPIPSGSRTLPPEIAGYVLSAKNGSAGDDSGAGQDEIPDV